MQERREMINQGALKTNEPGGNLGVVGPVVNDEYTNVQAHRDLQNEIEEARCAIKEYKKRIAETEAKIKGLDTRAPLLTEEEKQGIIMAKENGTSFTNFYEGVLHQSTAIKFGTQTTPERYKGVSEEELMEAWLYPEITKVTI